MCLPPQFPRPPASCQHLLGRKGGFICLWCSVLRVRPSLYPAPRFQEQSKHPHYARCPVTVPEGGRPGSRFQCELCFQRGGGWGGGRGRGRCGGGLGGGSLTAVPLVLPIPAVVLPVAAEDAGDAAVGVGALELTGQADVDVWGGQDGRVIGGEEAQGQGVGECGLRAWGRPAGPGWACPRRRVYQEPPAPGRHEVRGSPHHGAPSPREARGTGGSPHRSWPRHCCPGSRCPRRR